MTDNLLYKTIYCMEIFRERNIKYTTFKTDILHNLQKKRKQLIHGYYNVEFLCSFCEIDEA